MRIETLAHVMDLLRSRSNRALAIFDLDDTLVKPPRHLGSERWYRERIAWHRERGKSTEAATLAANAEWERVHGKIDVVLVEEASAGWLREIASVHDVIGLTARASKFAERTLAQLSQVGVQFTGVSGVTESEEFDRYRGGILFAGPLGSKGELLSEFLAHFRVRPQSVCFVDDRIEHVTTVSKRLGDSGIEVKTFHFSRTA